MLISCPECSHNVSDKAQACPQCGFPISTLNSPNNEQKPINKAPTSQSRARKYKRLPNGMGCVAKLTGVRRKPYAAYPPIENYHLNGSPIRPKAIGYYETYHDALTALTEYRKNPVLPSEYTFSKVYEKFLEDKFNDPMSRISFADSTIKNYRWAYGKCSALYDKPMNTIYRDDMQNIIDGLNLGYSSAGFLRTLFRSMFQFSKENGIVTTDYSEYIKIKQKRQHEKGVPFTSEEIKILWQNTKNYDATIALILIYSGLRISELKKCEIDLDDKVFRGGVKTESGKNRIVPIHEKILPLVKEFDQSAFSVGNYQDRLFNKMLTGIGFPYASTGEKHTPHDCRHTFSWLADKYKMDDLSKHLIMGHSLGKDVEKNTYGHRTLDELREEIAKISE